MIPIAMKDKVVQVLISNHVQPEQKLYKEMMFLVESRAVSKRSWVYAKDGSSKIVSQIEADKLIATGIYSDSPEGPFTKGEVKTEVVEVVVETPEVVEVEEVVAVAEAVEEVVEETPYDVGLEASMSNTKAELLTYAKHLKVKVSKDASKGTILGLIQAIKPE